MVNHSMTEVFHTHFSHNMNNILTIGIRLTKLLVQMKVNVIMLMITTVPILYHI